MGITLRDIAKEAGVTVSTVSRALNNKNNISPDVKKRIADIAGKYNYKKRTSAKIISYVIDKRFFLLTSHFYNRIIEGIEEGLKAHSYMFQFNSLDPENFSINSINMENLAGMIVTSAYHDDFIIEIRKMGIPIVLLDYYLPTEYIDSILIDNIDGIIVGMRYLHALGHKKILYLAGDTNTIGSFDRLTGYHRAIESFGLEVDESLIIKCDFSIQSAYEAMKRYLAREDVIATAVMAVNDIVAIGAMEAVKESNRKIPKEVSILGFDDIDLSDDVFPKLSTMCVPKKQMGRMAVDRLIQIMKGVDLGCTKIALRPTLLIRESTGISLTQNS